MFRLNYYAGRLNPYAMWAVYATKNNPNGIWKRPINSIVWSVCFEMNVNDRNKTSISISISISSHVEIFSHRKILTNNNHNNNNNAKMGGRKKYHHNATHFDRFGFCSLEIVSFYIHIVRLWKWETKFIWKARCFVTLYHKLSLNGRTNCRLDARIQTRAVTSVHMRNLGPSSIVLSFPSLSILIVIIVISLVIQMAPFKISQILYGKLP